MPPDDKDSALLPRRINGYWALIHRPMTPLGSHMWISYSPDLRHWGRHRLMLEARRGAWWDANKIGLSPPPIETSRGWLVLYHGVRHTPSGCLYRLGLALFDLENPEKCLLRGDSWIFGPEAEYERNGDEAAQLYSRYLSEFGQSDSAQAVNNYYAAALVGQGDYAAAGAQFVKTAFEYKDSSNPIAQQARRNAIVAYDSALAHNKNDRATQDAFFSAVDRFVAQSKDTELAKKALIQKGRRASETQRWDVLQQTFQWSVRAELPDDPYTPTAQKLVETRCTSRGSTPRRRCSGKQRSSMRLRRAVARSLIRSLRSERKPRLRSPILWSSRATSSAPPRKCTSRSLTRTRRRTRHLVR